MPIVETFHRLESAQCAFLRTKTLVFAICESDDSCFWNAFFFSIALFQLENQFFVNAGSALEVHPVWNDFFVGFLLPNIFEIFRLVWTGGLSGVFVVYSLPATVVDGSKSFSFPSCSLVRIVSSTTPGSVSQVHGFTQDKSVPYLFSTPQARSQEQTEILIQLLKILAPVNDITDIDHTASYKLSARWQAIEIGEKRNSKLITYFSDLRDWRDTFVFYCWKWCVL